MIQFEKLVLGAVEAKSCVMGAGLYAFSELDYLIQTEPDGLLTSSRLLI
ncbi:MAG: hypothetical protein WA421_14415 [Nitrososphaeraceae archaeon]